MAAISKVTEMKDNCPSTPFLLSALHSTATAKHILRIGLFSDIIFLLDLSLDWSRAVGNQASRCNQISPDHKIYRSSSSISSRCPVFEFYSLIKKTNIKHAKGIIIIIKYIITHIIIIISDVICHMSSS